jgi:hypothetical protein
MTKPNKVSTPLVGVTTSTRSPYQPPLQTIENQRLKKNIQKTGSLSTKDIKLQQRKMVFLYYIGGNDVFLVLVVGPKNQGLA